MRRTGFIDYIGTTGQQHRVDRQQRARNPMSVGVIVDANGIDVVLELEVRIDGRYSLVSRPYGASTGTTLAEGTVS